MVPYSNGTPPQHFSAWRKVSQVPSSCERVSCRKGAAFIWHLDESEREAERGVQEGKLWARKVWISPWGKARWAECKVPSGTYRNPRLDARWFLNVGWGHETGKKEGTQRLEDLETPGCCHMGYIRSCPIDGATSGFRESKSLACGSCEHMTKF